MYRFLWMDIHMYTAYYWFQKIGTISDSKPVTILSMADIVNAASYVGFPQLLGIKTCRQ